MSYIHNKLFRSKPNAYENDRLPTYLISGKT